MGWTVDTIKPSVDLIFRSLDVDYEIIHPESISPRILINHQGVIPVEAKEVVSKLFPENVSIEFHNVRFPSPKNVIKKKKGKVIQ